MTEGDQVRHLLDQAGVDDEEVADAAAQGPGTVVQLVARHLAFPGRRCYRAPEVWERAGVDEATAKKLWRAMGFPDVPDDEPAFADADIEALRLAALVFNQAHLEEHVALQQARTMSQSTARIAAAHQDVIASLSRLDDLAPMAEEAARLGDTVLPALDHLLVYLYRRHLAAATEQTLLAATEAGEARLTVGFADLVSFTALSEQLDEVQLAELIEWFNGVAADVVAEEGGRVVKTIGDEVMFSAVEPGVAASIALRLLDSSETASEPLGLRVGLAAGPVITRGGDIFGPTVNLASRLVGIARPASAIVDEAVYDALEDDPRFDFHATRPRKLKGIGVRRPYRLRPAS